VVRRRKFRSEAPLSSGQEEAILYLYLNTLRKYQKNLEPKLTRTRANEEGHKWELEGWGSNAKAITANAQGTIT